MHNAGDVYIFENKVLEEEYTILNNIDSECMAGRLEKYAETMIEETKKTDWRALAEITEVFLNAKRTDAAVFTAGNGGSHATASHMANDFLKGCRAHNRAGFRAECLGDANAILTCLANDFGYDEAYSVMLRTKGKPGDVFAYFSGSGNSPNLVNAAKAAREMGIVTVGFLGRDGGELKNLSDHFVIAPSESMERIEDIHMMYEHNMVSAIRATLEDEWGMEIVNHPPKNAGFRCALFDFDGTLSLIREGWQEIITPYFIDVLQQTPKAEDKKSIEKTW
jgi:D-sedoheptulose 7-phosphate isomerase